MIWLRNGEPVRVRFAGCVVVGWSRTLGWSAVRDDAGDRTNHSTSMPVRVAFASSEFASQNDIMLQRLKPLEDGPWHVFVDEQMVGIGCKSQGAHVADSVRWLEWVC